MCTIGHCILKKAYTENGNDAASHEQKTIVYTNLGNSRYSNVTFITWIGWLRARKTPKLQLRDNSSLQLRRCQTNKTNSTLCKCPRRQVLIIIFFLSSSSCHRQWSLFRLHILILFLGVSAKLRKATISFVMSVCPHGTRLQLDGFSENLISERFPPKICRGNSSFIRS